MLEQCSEPVAQGCSVKKVFLEISQNSQESACARVSFLIKLVFSCEFCETSKITFSCRTPPVVAFECSGCFRNVLAITLNRDFSAGNINQLTFGQNPPQKKLNNFY